jgi:CheY-like chemotaxis protein
LPAVVLLDLIMPNMTGLQLRNRLRNEPGFETLPSIVMTGHEPMLRALANAEPQMAVLLKPLDFDKLLARVAASCNAVTTRRPVS